MRGILKQPSLNLPLKNNSIADLSLNNIAMSKVGAISSNGIFGEADGAFDFDGSDDRIYANAKASDVCRTTFTINLWCKCDNLDNSNQAFFTSDLATASPTTPYVRLFKSNNVLVAYIGSNNTNISVVGDTTFTSDWTMVTLTCNGDGSTSSIKLFFNGVECGSNSGAHTNINLEKYMSVGVLNYNRLGGTQIWFFDGKIASVKVFSQILSDIEIQILHRQKGRIE